MGAINTVLNFVAGAAVAGFRIVKPGASETLVVQSSAATDTHSGVCVQPNGAALGFRVDVCIDGPADVEYGGTIARGDLVTADASGRAIKATASVGSNVRIIGDALASGVVGDIGRINVQPGSFQG